MKNKANIEARAKQLNLSLEIYENDRRMQNIKMYGREDSLMELLTVRREKQYGATEWNKAEISWASGRGDQEEVEEFSKALLFSSEILRYWENEGGEG